MGTQIDNQVNNSADQRSSPKEVRQYGIDQLKKIIQSSEHEVTTMEKIAAIDVLTKYINE